MHLSLAGYILVNQVALEAVTGDVSISTFINAALLAVCAHHVTQCFFPLTALEQSTTSSTGPAPVPAHGPVLAALPAPRRTGHTELPAPISVTYENTKEGGTAATW